MPAETLLRLDVQIPEGRILLNKPCLVTARLENIGESSFVVNRRMAVGMKDIVSRELYADLTTLGGGYVEVRDVSYDRDFSPPGDYIALEPGATISKTFNLFEWYKPLNPGRYQLVLHYQADEPLAKTPEGVVEGVHSSQAVEITVEALIQGAG